MATRRYTRRTRLSQSVERPVGNSPQANSDVSNGDTPVLAPSTAATGPSAPSTPVQMLDLDTSQNNADTQALDRALAASLASPVRKQRRVVQDDAPPDGHQQELGNNSARPCGQRRLGRQQTLLAPVTTLPSSPAAVCSSECWVTREVHRRHTRMRLQKI